MSANATGTTTSTALHRFAVFTAGCTFLLVLAGALVTSNDAGLAVPDWPLSYGSLMPPMVGGIFYEHGHRLVATSVGLLTIVLAVWLALREPRRWVRRLGWLALGAVVLQGLLGGLTVLFLLPRPVSIAHASLAQVFFCLTVALAVFTSRSWQAETSPVEDTGSPSLRQLSTAATGAIFLQLVLGAAYRHSAIGILPHLAGAALVAYLGLSVFRRTRNLPAAAGALNRPARLLVWLVLAQLGLGVAAYLARLAAANAPQPLPLMVALTVGHVAAGALILATSAVLTLQAHKHLRGRGEVVSLPSVERAAV
ncbi:MAG: heme A synthase [Terriglobia bacterium]